MRTRVGRLLAIGACLSAFACGTRVDESVLTQQTILVPITGGAAGPGATVLGSDGSPLAVGNTGGTGNNAGGTSGGNAGSGSATDGGITPASGAPILLGAVGTKSGIVGAALENAFRGLTVWQEWVNSHGGVQGRPVQILQVDDAADPGKHVAAVKKMILEDQVVSFIGNIAPFTLSAGVPLLEQYNVSAIGGDGGDAAWFTSPLTFPINGTTVSRSRPPAAWAIDHLPQRKAAVFYVNEADAPGVLARNFMDEWRKRGGQVVLDVGVSIAQPDFTGQIIQARNAGADIVYTVLEKAACNRIFDAARRQSYTPIWLNAACTIDNARDHADTMTNKDYALHQARPIVGVTPAEQEALAAIARYDPSLPPDGAFLFAWLAGKLFEEAMAQPGAVMTASGVIDAMHRLPATTLGGLTPLQAWPPGPHPEGRCGMLSKFDGTRFVLQTPDFICVE